MKLQRDGVAAVAEWYRYRTVACLVTSSSPVPLKTHRVGQQCTLNRSRAETSSRWFIFGEEFKKKWNVAKKVEFRALPILLREPDIVNFIKIQRNKWAGYVVKKDANRTTRKVFSAQLIGTRRKGRPNLRWIYGLEKALLVWRTKNFRTLARKRLAWKRTRKDKDHLRQSSHGGRKESYS
ncbi:uncharacterized protein TNCV_534761 [Trichonephila clavipes]|nr:uncharacterized protein TNCV_534761 [Trichonephila clavipes]